MANVDKNIERLKLAKELIEKKELPEIVAPDMLEAVEVKQRNLRSRDIQRGKMYPMEIDDISALVENMSKSNVIKARKVLKKKIIGITCHNSIRLAKNAIKNKADYIAFGAFFISKTKKTRYKAKISILNSIKKISKMIF